MVSHHKIFEFYAAVRGFHFYRSIWQPQEHQILSCVFECGNHYDMFAVKTCDENGRTVGHLPREISRITKFIIDRAATVTACIIGTHYRRSPLVQGGLEIPCKISVRILGTCSNLLVLERYKELCNELYVEPKNEEILGSFMVKAFEPELPVPPVAKKKRQEKRRC